MNRQPLLPLSLEIERSARLGHRRAWGAAWLRFTAALVLSAALLVGSLVARHALHGSSGPDVTSSATVTSSAPSSSVTLEPESSADSAQSPMVLTAMPSSDIAGPIEEPPDPPGGPVDVSVSCESSGKAAVLRWSQPADGGEVLSYTVSRDGEFDVVDASVREFAWDNDGRVHEFSIQSDNADGSTPGSTVTFPTTPPAPTITSASSYDDVDGTVGEVTWLPGDGTACTVSQYLVSTGDSVQATLDVGWDGLDPEAPLRATFGPGSSTTVVVTAIGPAGRNSASSELTALSTPGGNTPIPDSTTVEPTVEISVTSEVPVE